MARYKEYDYTRQIQIGIEVISKSRIIIEKTGLLKINFFYRLVRPVSIEPIIVVKNPLTENDNYLIID